MTTTVEYKKLAIYFLMGMRKIRAINNNQLPNPSSEPAEPVNIERSTTFIIASNEVLSIAEWIAVSIFKRQIT